MTRPPPAPLVVRPGKYRTRRGVHIKVVRFKPSYTDSIYHWSNEDQTTLYTNQGEMFPGQKWPGDLIARIKKPKPQPAPGKRGKRKMQWGVWIPRASKNDARLLIQVGTTRHQSFNQAIIRKLPIGRGRKA